jgi:hypothetical protein
MIDGPGPPITRRNAGAPTRWVPDIRCAVIRRSDTGVVGACETQRILFLWSVGRGERSGSAQRIAAILAALPSRNGIRGFGSLKPPRAQTGSSLGATRAGARQARGLNGAADPLTAEGAAPAGPPQTAAQVTTTRTRTTRSTLAVYTPAANRSRPLGFAVSP